MIWTPVSGEKDGWGLCRPLPDWFGDFLHGDSLLLPMLEWEEASGWRIQLPERSHQASKTQKPPSLKSSFHASAVNSITTIPFRNEGSLFKEQVFFSPLHVTLADAPMRELLWKQNPTPIVQMKVPYLQTSIKSRYWWKPFVWIYLYMFVISMIS